MNKTNMFIVIKRKDALKYLTDVEKQNLENILDKITSGREKDNKKPVNYYYVCNTDEPYANAVHDVIIGGEAVKVSKFIHNKDACESNSNGLENREKTVSWNTFISGESELKCESLEDAQLLLEVCKDNQIDCAYGINAEDYKQEPYWYIEDNELYITKYTCESKNICSCWTVKGFVEEHTR